jgi:hypothetical protein
VDALGEDVHIWLELLELLILFIYRGSNTPRLSLSEAGRFSRRRLTEQRSHWLAIRDEEGPGASLKSSSYDSWAKVEERFFSSTRERQNRHQPAEFATMSLLFFTVSARLARLTNKPLSATWTKLAARFMSQVALESYLGAPAYDRTGTDQLSLAFAWGWVPPACWDKDRGWSHRDGADLELMINQMFAYNESSGTATQENPMWTETRLNLLSRFDMSRQRQGDRTPGPPTQDLVNTYLESLAKETPIDEFEERVVSFVRQIWEFFRKPLLVQIEEGQVDGMSADEFEEFKRRTLLPI